MSLNDMLVGVQVLNNSWNPEYAPVHANNNVSETSLIQMAVEAGVQIVRIPLDLSIVTQDGYPQWQLDAFEEILAVANANNIQVIFQPGQTPAELTPNGNVQEVPDNMADLQELAGRYAAGVEQIYTNFGAQYSETISGWEVGNEPNLSYDYTQQGAVSDSTTDHRFFSMAVENGEWYAEYLHAVNEAVNALNIEVGGNPLDVNIIGAGIAHNDVAYMDAMFARLEQLGAEIDGFSIHPYTTNSVDDSGNQQAPESGRPTDWIIQPSDYSESWDTYYGFQGALYNAQALMNKYGFSDADLWMTEFGVPSYLGFRNAGEDGIFDENGTFQAGVLDQARWYAEAFGVIDSWDNSSLMGIMAHHVLDNKSYEFNSTYNAYDNDPNNDGTWFEGEGAFGLFHEVNGQIVAKPGAYLMASVTSGSDFQLENIHSNYTLSTLDFSSELASTGLVSGVIVLSHGGDDIITGSDFDDSLFVGDGNDTVDGGDGNDRIYGGQGNDAITGGDGNDDLYGNTGDDNFWTGKGSDRVDGGTGLDRLILSGEQADYFWIGDGEKLSLSGNGQTIQAINLEVLEFADGEVILENADINRGNGGIAADQNSAPKAMDDAGLNLVPGAELQINVLANDSDADNDGLTITGINGNNLQVGEAVQVVGLGLVRVNADYTLSIAAEQGASGAYSFTYTISDGDKTDTATVTGEVLPVTNTAPLAANDAITLAVGEALIIDPLVNDSDVDNDVLTITQINGIDMQAGWSTWINDIGLLTLNADNTLMLEVDAAYSGAYEFSYTLSDGNNETTATISGTMVDPQTGTAGANTLNGSRSADVLFGDGGNDKIKGKGGNDTIDGGSGNDRIFGQGGSDFLKGGAGNDKLWGGGGDDILSGGSGNDLFIFNGKLGNDIITDFEGGAGSSDRINLRKYDFDSFADIQSAMSETPDGTVLLVGSGSILFKDVDMSEFAADDFLI